MKAGSRHPGAVGTSTPDSALLHPGYAPDCHLEIPALHPHLEQAA